MKAQQNQKAINVLISILVLIILFNCKTTKVDSSVYEKYEEYKLIKGLLSHLENTNFKSDTIIIIDTILKFSTDNFIKSIDKFQEAKNVVVSPSKCADSIYNKFDFENVLESPFKKNVWDSRKIIELKAKYKNIKDITWHDKFSYTYISLSHPLFNKQKKIALIKVNKSSSGEVIYFLRKKTNVWKVNCELYLSQY